MQEIRTLVFAVAILPLCVACSEDASAEDPTTPERQTTYYVIRHAERNPGDDPPLNDEGAARAERLADALEQAGIDEIVTTSFIRGQQTAQPLSNRTDAPMAVAPFEKAATPWPEFALDVAAWQREREVAGATYLMIGHSGGYNTTLLEKLGAPSSGTLAEAYQDLVILVREPDGSVKLSILQYGGESSLDP